MAEFDKFFSASQGAQELSGDIQRFAGIAKYLFPNPAIRSFPMTCSCAPCEAEKLYIVLSGRLLKVPVDCSQIVIYHKVLCVARWGNMSFRVESMQTESDVLD